MADSAVVPQTVLDGFIDVLNEWTMMPCPSFTCSEAERLAALARAAGYPDTADALLYAHSEGDDEGDDHFEMTAPADGEPD